jgi:hypothetical protein
VKRPYLDRWLMLKDLDPEHRAKTAFLLWLTDNDTEMTILMTKIRDHHG